MRRGISYEFEGTITSLSPEIKAEQNLCPGFPSLPVRQGRKNVSGTGLSKGSLSLLSIANLVIPFSLRWSRLAYYKKELCPVFFILPPPGAVVVIKVVN